jgi:hypothetical protein
MKTVPVLRFVKVTPIRPSYPSLPARSVYVSESV